MPRPSTLQPKYRHYKPKDPAVVRLDGRDVYLGKYGSPESPTLSHRPVARWLAREAAEPDEDQQGTPKIAREEPVSPTVGELIAAFWTQHADGHYRHADGTPTGELDNFRDSLWPLRRLYGAPAAAAFGPKCLKLVRQAVIDAGLARTTINQRVGRIVHLFKWGVEQELIPPAVHQALKAVAGLERGRTAARESSPVRPVPEADVEAIRPHVSRQVWAMIELQRLTGMRSVEVTIMRTADLDTSGAVWAYVPRRHKTGHRGHDRTIYLGPRAQAALEPWLRADPSEFLFSPREAMAEFRAAQRRDRTTPLYPSQRTRQLFHRRRRVPGQRAAGDPLRRAGERLKPPTDPHSSRARPGATAS
jgi:integrase